MPRVSPLGSARNDAIARGLAAEGMGGWLIASLREQGVPMLLLKGISTETWLYRPDEVRPSSDVDVLVRPRDFAIAERILHALGFTNRYDGPSPDWAEEHADAWVHGAWPLPVDLHRRVWGMGVEPEVVWAELTAGAVTLSLAGEDVAVPRDDARLVLLVLHAAHHGAGAPRPIAEVRRAVEQLTEPTWRLAADAARRLGAERSLADGLRLVPEAAGLLEALGLSGMGSAPAPEQLRLWEAPPTTEGFLRLRQAGTWAERLELVRRELVPSVAFMRSRSLQAPLARRGAAGLFAAYPVRWVYLCVNGGRGWRASRRSG